MQAGDKVFEKDGHQAPDVQELRGTYKVYHVTDLNVANVRPRTAPNAPAALGVPLGRPPGGRRPCRVRCRARPPEATLAAARNEGVATVVLDTPPRSETAALATPPGRPGGHPVPAADGRPRDRSATVKLLQLVGGPAAVAACSPFRLVASGPIRLAGTAAPQRAGVPAHDRASRRLGRCRRPGADSGRASAQGPCRGRAAAAWSFPNLRNNRSCLMAKKPNLALVADAAAGRKPAPAAPARPRGRVGTVALTINVHPDVRQQTEDPRAFSLSWFGSATRLAPRRQTGCRTPCSAP